MRKEKELRKTSLPVLLYGGVSNTHYLLTGKVKKLTEKKEPEKEKRAKGFFGIFAFGFVVVFIIRKIVYTRIVSNNNMDVGNKWIKLAINFKPIMDYTFDK